MRILRLAAMIVGILGAAVGLSGQPASATPLVGSLPAAASTGDNSLVAGVQFGPGYGYGYGRRFYRPRYYYPRRAYYAPRFYRPRRAYYPYRYRPRIVCRIRYTYYGPRRVCFRRY